MVEIGGKAYQFETAILQRLAIGVVLRQGKTKIRLAEFSRSQPFGKVVTWSANDCASKQAGPPNLLWFTT